MEDRYKALALDYVKIREYSGTLEAVRKEVFRDFTGKVLLFRLPWARVRRAEPYRAVLIEGYDPGAEELVAMRERLSLSGGPFHFTRGREGLLVMNLGEESFDFVPLMPEVSAHTKSFFFFMPMILDVPDKHLVFRL